MSPKHHSSTSWPWGRSQREKHRCHSARALKGAGLQLRYVWYILPEATADGAGVDCAREAREEIYKQQPSKQARRPRAAKPDRPNQTTSLPYRQATARNARRTKLHKLSKLIKEGQGSSISGTALHVDERPPPWASTADKNIRNPSIGQTKPSEPPFPYPSFPSHLHVGTPRGRLLRFH